MHGALSPLLAVNVPEVSELAMLGLEGASSLFGRDSAEDRSASSIEVGHQVLFSLPISYQFEIYTCNVSFNVYV